MKETKYIIHCPSGYLSEIRYERNDPRLPYAVFAVNKKKAVKFSFKELCHKALRILGIDKELCLIEEL